MDRHGWSFARRSVRSAQSLVSRDDATRTTSFATAVMARNVRVLENEQAIATPLEYQIGDLRIAAHRTVPATLNPKAALRAASLLTPAH
jgi:hypothetical protein